MLFKSFRYARVPVGVLLVLMRDVQQALFGEVITNNLQPY
jgi:hypothetical protein